MEITKEQYEEFKRRKANPVVSDTEFQNYYDNHTGPKLTLEAYLAFLKATDEKCE